MFTAALFTTARIYKQPKSPSTNEWIRYGKYNEILFSHKVAIWVHLESVIQRKVRPENQISYINTYTRNLEN